MAKLKETGKGKPKPKRLYLDGAWTQTEIKESAKEAKMMYDLCGAEIQDLLQREARENGQRIFDRLIFHLKRSAEDRLAQEKYQKLSQNDDRI